MTTKTTATKRTTTKAKAVKAATQETSEMAGETTAPKARTLGVISEEWAMADASREELTAAVRVLRSKAVRRRPGAGAKLYLCQRALKARYSIDIAAIAQPREAPARG